MRATKLADPLWVPALTHYRKESGRAVIDEARMAAHLKAMQPAVRQFLIAGSTGDGWELSLDQLMTVVALSRRPDVFTSTNVMFGILRPTTEEVVAYAKAVEEGLRRYGMPAGTFAGFAICPPVDATASDLTVQRHYEAVLQSTTSPIAVYQLPQVTGCTISTSVFHNLARTPRITMFKDTSGTDTVANAGPVQGVAFVRGAEGGYLEALPPEGPYDGWLLSTGNAFGGVLRRILELRDGDRRMPAQMLSAVLARIVETLFEAARDVGFGNAFSNANRAADHVLAYGAKWRAAPPPLTASGNVLPEELLRTADDLLGALLSLDRPYMSQL